MPRVKSTAPTTRVEAYLTQENASNLRLITFNEVSGRNAFGRTSAIINQALKEFFERAAGKEPNVLP